MVSDTPAGRPARTSALLRLALFVAVLLLAWGVARRMGWLALADPALLSARLASWRAVPWIAPAFVGVYAIAASLSLPATPFTLAGGALFGAGQGTVLNWAGATLGATGAFLIARGLGRGAVQALLGSRAGIVDRLQDAVTISSLLRLRLLPIVPFNGLNFGAGLAGVKPSVFVASTAMGIVPGTFIYTYFADALLAGASGAQQNAFVSLAIATSLLIALSFVPTLARRMGWMTLLLLAPLGAARAGAQGVDHAPFTAMLQEHVTRGLVDYDRFARDPRFQAYLTSLNAARPEQLSPTDRLAYWINVYNAYTIELINSRKERRSIRRINRRLGVTFKSPWAEPIVRAGGRVLTLDDVEHRIVRKEFNDPRIHAALVCAALGCPPLRAEAFEGARLSEQLDDQVRTFLAQRDKNRVDVGARVVHGSPIFTWYREDFGGSLQGVGAFWARFVTDPAARKLLESGDFRWEDTAYDWSLNIRR